MKLKGKVAVVTGASSGMGREIAYVFAKEGAVVYAAARRLEKLEELAEKTKDFEGKIIPVSSNLINQEDAEKLIEYAYSDSGKLDILVNNAGIMDDFSGVGDVNDEMMNKVFDLNVFAPFYTSRKAVNIFLKEGKGVIVNIASIGGLYGARAGAVYTASKHALVGLTKNTGYMYATKNIRCNAICPGAIETDIGSGEYMKHVNQDGMNTIMANIGGNPRSGSPAEIAEIAVFLASDESSLINGQCLAADAGWTAF